MFFEKILGKPFGWVISFIYSLVPNYLVVTLILALLIKIILFPFGIKQQKNMVKQATLRPKENAIRKKYAGRNDKATQQKMQTEIMELYQKENFNPVGGCLPLFLQLPIVYALYAVIRKPLTYICGLSAEAVEGIGNKLVSLGFVAEDKLKAVTEIEFISIIRNNNVFDGVKEFFEGTKYTTLEKLPDFRLFSVDLGEIPSFAFNWLILVPILTFVIMVFSMKLTRKFSYQPQTDVQGGCSGKGMDYVMPLFSVWICFIVPAIVGIYWIFQNILGTLQQYILKLMYPYPTFTEEEMKAAEKELLGTSRKGKKDSGSDKPKVRSLHHIDDDDYIVSEPEKTAKKPVGDDKDALIPRAELKDDKKDRE